MDNMKPNSPRVMVTGANGFVGNALCATLEKNEFSVLAVSRNTPTSSKFPQHETIKNIDAATDWSSMLNGTSIIIHLAARVHVMNEVDENPLTAFQEINLNGTVNLAQQAAAAGVERFVYVSSIKVNGEYTEQGKMFSEKDIPCPQDPYAISKLQAELALHDLAKSTDMQIVIVRPPLVYGSGVKANFLKLMQLVDKAVPLPLGSINNARSMIYVGNLVDALITCATHPEASGQTYLVSDDEHISTQALVRRLAVVWNRPARVFPCPLWLLSLIARVSGKSHAVNRITQSLMIDNDKIKSQLGWRPPFTLDQGLIETAKWFQATRG